MGQPFGLETMSLSLVSVMKYAGAGSFSGATLYQDELRSARSSCSIDGVNR